MSASISLGGERGRSDDDARDEQLAEIIPHDHPRLVVPHRLPILLAVMTAMTMQMLDTTIANVALPHMQASLGATQDTVTWVLTSYVLASAVALPLSGWLVDRFGIKRLLLFSVITFTAASALCGMAQNLDQMVAFRILQGLAGAFLAPIAQTVLLDLSSPSERSRMMMIFTQGMMIGPIMGPMIGGYLTENFDWRWVFYVNVPIGIGCVLALLAFFPATPTHKRPFDLLGWALVAIAVSSLQLMLDRGTSQDWFGSPEIVAYLVISLCAFWMTVVHIATAKHPLFSRRLFRDRNFAASLMMSAFFGLVLMSTMALLPSLLQTIYGYPAIDAGLLLTPRGLGMLASMTLFGRYITSSDPRVMLTIGFSLMGSSLLMMSRWAPDMPVGPIIAAGLVQGVGMSMSMVPLNMIAFATLPGDIRTDGSGLSNLVRNLGSSTGITLCTVLLGNSIQVNHAEIGEHLTATDLPFALERITAYGGTSEAVMRAVDGMVNKQAAMIGYLNDFLLMGIGCFLLIPLLFLMKRPQLGGTDANAVMAEAGH